MFLAVAGICQYRDAGLWASFSLKADINKKLSLDVSPEIRLNENLTQLSRAFIDYGAQYKINKLLFATATWRGGQANAGEYFETRRRVQLGLGAKKKLEDFVVTFQSRGQLSTNPNRVETDVDFNTTWRNKVAVKYEAKKKLDISTSFELFHQEGRIQSLELTDWRWTAGVERRINKSQSFELGYLIQKSILDSPQELDFVFLLSYKMELRSKKKKSVQGDSAKPAVTGE
jgi:hypothetical protein